MASWSLPRPLLERTAGLRKRHYGGRYVRPLIHLLMAGDAGIRETAAYRLTSMGDRRAVRPLLRVAANRHELPAVRGQALEAVGAISLGRPTPPVDQVIDLLDDPQVEVRFWACYALSQFGDARAIPRLQRLLSDEAICPGWWSVKGEAAWAIATLEEDPRADAIWNANSQARASGGDPGCGAGSGTG